MNFLFILSFFSRKWGAGLKIPSFSLWLVFSGDKPVTSRHPRAIPEPTQNQLITTKDTPLAQESARVVGGLCQEPGEETCKDDLTTA